MPASWTILRSSMQSGAALTLMRRTWFLEPGTRPGTSAE